MALRVASFIFQSKFILKLEEIIIVSIIGNTYVFKNTGEEIKVTGRQDEYWEITKNNEAGVINKIDLDDFIANGDLYLKNIS